MSLFSRFFYKRPPDGLLEFTDRVYVFDSCFSTEVLPDGMYDIYLREILTELHEQFEDSSFLAFNFRKGEKRSHFAEVLCEYDVTVIDYPHQYEGCPLLPLSLIQHFLLASESWLSYGNQQNIILLHCERGGWPLLAFILASIVIFKRPQSGEKRTLETVHREAPKGFLQLLSPLNPMQSQLRYLQYVARRNISSEWPPMERSLSLDCLILRSIPSFDATNGCRPAIRIFGQNLHGKDTRRTIMLFSTSQKKKSLRHYKQVDCDVIKIDIQCAVRGDIVLECVHLDLDPEREVMMFRIMFNTAFIRSNILMLNCEDLDILWDARDRYPKGFRAEVLFGETDVNSSQGDPTAALNAEEQGGLPIEAFSSVQEIFSSVDWLNSSDSSAIWFLKQISATVLQEKIERLIMTDAKELSKLRNNMMDQMSVTSSLESEEENYESETAATVASFDDDSNLDIVDVASQTETDCTTGTVQEVNIPTSKEVPEQIVYNILNSSVQTFIPLKSASAHEGDTLSCSDSSSEPSPSLPPTSLATEADEASSLCTLPTPSKCPPPTSPAPPPPSPPPFTTQKILASHDKVHLPLHSTTSLPSTVTVLIPPPPPPPAMSSPLTMEPTSLPLTAPPFILVSHGLSSPPLAPPLPPTTRKTSPLVPPTPLLSPAASTVSSKGPPPPPPPPPPSFHLRTTLHNGSPCGSRLFSKAAAPPPPSCISFSQNGLSNEVTPPPAPPKSSHGVATPPPPPLPPKSSHGAAPPPPPPPLPPKSSHGAAPPPPPPPPPIQRPISKVPIPPPISGLAKKIPAPPPPPPHQKPGKKVPSPPPLPSSSPPEPPRIPPPPPPLHTGNHENASGPPQQSGTKLPSAQTPSAPCVGNFRTSISCTERGRASLSSNNAPKKSALKPLHWVKVTRAMQGSLWADTTKQDNQARSPDIDISELESLFSTAVATEGRIMNKSGVRRNPNANKSEIVHLVDMRRANNCEIMLTKIKMPLQDMVSAILALDASVLDIDQVENLIKFCPTKEEIEMLKNYSGNRETLGRCEQFFLELMKVPRVESKLRVFSFRITFSTQVKELRSNLNIINDASREVKGSIKLKQIMQTILTLGNVLNQGTARGSAVGFRLDSLLKLSDTRARNNKMTLMHYLCKILGEKMPELLDFDKDLLHLEAASKIQLKLVAEEMQAVSKGLEKVEQELAASESDGAISVTFRKALKEFLHTAEAEVRSLISLYSEVGRNADSLAQYFGEDPVRCPFEQVTSILAVFVNMFKKSREENARQAEAEKKKLEKEAIKDKTNSSAKKDLVDVKKIRDWQLFFSALMLRLEIYHPANGVHNLSHLPAVRSQPQCMCRHRFCLLAKKTTRRQKLFPRERSLKVRNSGAIIIYNCANDV